MVQIGWRIESNQKTIKKIIVMGEKITISNGKLNVPNNPIIPYIQGDGIGIDIWPASHIHSG